MATLVDKERSNLVFCPDCGKEVTGGEPFRLGYYNFLSKSPDMEDIYQLIRMRNKGNKCLEEELDFLENHNYVKGKYYRKLCHTLRYGRSHINSLIYFTPEYKEACETLGKSLNLEDSTLANLADVGHEIFESIRKKICEEEIVV